MKEYTIEYISGREATITGELSINSGDHFIFTNAEGDHVAFIMKAEVRAISVTGVLVSSRSSSGGAVARIR